MPSEKNQAQGGPDTGDAELEAAAAYMVSVLSDPKASDARKDKMALALLQYRGGTSRKGKPPSKQSKSEVKAQRARDVGERFASRTPPKLAVVR